MIVDLSIEAQSFALGRTLPTEEGRIELETLVPIGDRAVPFLRRRGHEGAAFVEAVRERPNVERIRPIESSGDETLYEILWDIPESSFLFFVRQTGGHVLDGVGESGWWSFDLRFPTHEALSAFRRYCADAEIPIDVNRVYRLENTGGTEPYGLTEAQRETLRLAVLEGYYSIPREVSTQELADEFGISDQAVTERLRRAITALVSNTLLSDEGGS